MIVLPVFLSGFYATPALADNSNPGTSLTDNYALLDGTSGYKQGFQSAATTNYLGGNPFFTVEAWLLPSSALSSTNGSIFVKTDMVQYEIESGAFTAIFNSGGWKALISTGVRARIGQWQHVAFVKSNNTLTLYLNGDQAFRLVDSTNIPTYPFNSYSYLSIGSNPWNGSVNASSPQSVLFAGGIDEVKVWTTARTQA